MFPSLAEGSGIDGMGDSGSSAAGMNQGWRKGWLAKLKYNYYLSERKIRRRISDPGICDHASGVFCRR